MTAGPAHCGLSRFLARIFPGVRIVNQRETAAHFGVHVDTLKQWTADHVIPAPRGRGGYDIEKCSQGLAAAFIALKRQKTVEVVQPSADPKAELDELKVQKARMDLAKERREFLPTRVLEHYAEQVGSIVHAALEAIPGQIKARIPHLRAAEVAMIRQLLVKIANQIAKFDARDPSGT